MRLDQNRDGVFSREPRSQGKDMPVLLTYNTSLKIGEVKRPDEQIVFKNPYRGPMWVDEFGFFINGTLANLGAESPFTLAYNTFTMRMKINGRYIIDEFVPLTLLAPHTDTLENVPDSYNKSFFWRLSKPMWLDELDDISIELAWKTDLNIYAPAVVTALASVTVPVAVSMKGRATTNAKRPSERHLPFHAVWGPSTVINVDLGTETGVISPDSALRNGRNTPVHITRALGFLNERPTTATSNIAYSDLLMNLRISHSAGYYIVKDLTPFYELFQNVSRAADFKFTLAPKEFVTIELQTGTITLVNYPGGNAGAFNYLFGFSIQGYSTEALQ